MRRGHSVGTQSKLSSLRPPAAWLWLALTIFWMGFMFDKSAQPYVQQDIRPWLSAHISESRLSVLLPNATFAYDGQHITPAKPYDMAEFFLRKGGHVGEYALLAWLWMRTLHSRANAGFPRHLLIAAAISLLFAATDEWHQTFVPGRTGHAVDVAVDACGILLAAALEWGMTLLVRHRQQRKK